MLYLICRTILNLEHDRTFQRTYVPFHGNASAYFVGVIFGYEYYSRKNSGAKKTKVCTLCSNSG